MTLLSRMVLALAVAVGWAASPAADTTDATCVFRNRGEKKEAPSGACTFSQRRGNISIELDNDRSFELKPSGEANHYEDQTGAPVVRRVHENGDHVYKWVERKDERTLRVRFGGDSGRGSGEAEVGETPRELRDLVHGERVGGEVDDELRRRGYRHVDDSTSGDEAWSNWRNRSTKECVTVHFRNGNVRSIVNVPKADCR